MYFSLCPCRESRAAQRIVILKTSRSHSLEDRQRSQMRKTDIYCRNPAIGFFAGLNAALSSRKNQIVTANQAPAYAAMLNDLLISHNVPV